MELELTKAELKANEILNEVDQDKKSLIVDDSINLENELPLEEAKNTKEFTSVIGDVIDKGVNYAIKALPIASGVKDVALDVKEALKTNDFKEIIKTAVGSSIREGLEYLSMPTNILKDIKSLQKVALSGGITKALSAGVDIIFNKYLKNNLFGNLAKDFITTVKNFITSKEFINKLESAFKKIGEKINKFKETCDLWYKAYEKFDLNTINDLSKEVAKKSRNISEHTDCLAENKLIQNITSMINNTKEKLSSIQMEACKIV